MIDLSSAGNNSAIDQVLRDIALLNRKLDLILAAIRHNSVDTALRAYQIQDDGNGNQVAR